MNPDLTLGVTARGLLADSDSTRRYTGRVIAIGNAAELVVVQAAKRQYVLDLDTVEVL